MAHPFTPGQRFNHIAGTHEYIGPEVWKADYNEDAEMSSLGVTLYTLLKTHAAVGTSQLWTSNWFLATIYWSKVERCQLLHVF